MRQVTVAANVPVPIDQYLTPINIAYVATGSGTVEVSYTNPFPLDAQGYPETNGPTLVWQAGPSSPIKDDPIRAIRVTGGTNPTLTVIQAGVR